MCRKNMVILLPLIFTVGCAGITNTFIKVAPDYSKVPEEELRSFAAAVEGFVIQGDREPSFETYPSIMADNEEIGQVVRTRAARVQLVQELLNSGFAYEQKSGTISIIRSREYKRATTSRKRDQNALLVMSENANRWTLYETLVKTSNWSPGALGAVQDSFYEARCALMSPGQKYEGPDGEMVMK